MNALITKRNNSASISKSMNERIFEAMMKEFIEKKVEEDLKKFMDEKVFEAMTKEFIERQVSGNMKESEEVMEKMDEQVKDSIEESETTERLTQLTRDVKGVDSRKVIEDSLPSRSDKIFK